MSIPRSPLGPVRDRGEMKKSGVFLSEKVQIQLQRVAMVTTGPLANNAVMSQPAMTWPGCNALQQPGPFGKNYWRIF